MTQDSARRRQRPLLGHDEKAALAELGYCSVSLLADPEIERLRAVVADLAPPDRRGIAIANVDPDRRFMLAFHAATGWFRAQVLAAAFPDHRVAFTTVAVKHPGPDSALGPHDDGTYVDTDAGRSYTVWIPLVDCDDRSDNGMIRVLPGSHLVGEELAGSNVTDWYDGFRDELTEFMRPVPTAAGNAVVWDSRLIHDSTPNWSTASRPVVIAELVPRGAQLIHVEATGARHRRVLAVDEEFHRMNSPILVRHRMAPYPEIRRFDVVTHRPTADELTSCGLPPDMAPRSHRPVDDWFIGRPDGLALQTPAAGSRPAWLDDSLVETARRDVASHLDDLMTIHGSLSDELPSECKVGEQGHHRLGFAAPSHATAEALLPRTARVLAEDPSVMEAWLLALPSATAVAPSPGGGYREFVLPISLPTGRTGVATGSDQQRFDFGVPVALDPGASRQLFNEGTDELRLLLVRVGDRTPEPTTAPRRRWLRTRADRSGRAGP